MAPAQFNIDGRVYSFQKELKTNQKCDVYFYRKYYDGTCEEVGADDFVEVETIRYGSKPIYSILTLAGGSRILVDKLPKDIEKSARKIEGRDLRNLLDLATVILAIDDRSSGITARLDEVIALQKDLIHRLDGMKQPDTVPESIVSTSSGTLPVTTSPAKKPRKAIPKKVREEVWKKRNGASFDGRCFCCETDLRFEAFEVGHVIPVADGGNDSVDNLEPVCRSCNRSMGKRNMLEFKKTHFSTTGFAENS